jgi:hypothetical protein
MDPALRLSLAPLRLPPPPPGLARAAMRRALARLRATELAPDHLVAHARPRSSDAGSAAATAPAEPPPTPPPPDLRARAPRGVAWAAPPARWVVFSDLHLSPRTEPVALAVLRRVLAEARARRGGVVFGGDFWHARGALPVAPLNAVLTLLAEEWDVPTLMLVGNHDQATPSGREHALTPLAAARPDAVHVFDEPALYAGALWLPYRRDARILAAALAAAAADEETRQSGGLRAVFAHADVAGASLNDAHQARDGLPPRLFPPGVPTYTGHYHKPHTVPGTAIRYVGSPYQVSRAEAGQAKALLVLDARWRAVEEVPLDLGPRHFALAATAPAAPAGGGGEGGGGPAAAAEGGNAAAAAEAVGEREEPGEGEPAAGKAATTAAAAEAEAAAVLGLALPAGLRRGDRLRLTLAPAAGGAAAAERRLLRALGRRGVEVEVVAPPAAAPPPRIAAAEELGPEELWAAFCALRALPPAVAARGAGLLAAALGGGGALADGGADGAAAPRPAPRGPVTLSFAAVEVEGYFSFKERVRYDLASRGLVVVTGRLEGGAGLGAGSAAGAEAAAGGSSNGAGKTALVMAPLWALTGAPDARAEGGGGGRGLAVADVVNDDCATAFVRVEGTVNGEPFAVERRVARRGRGGGLRLEIGGVDLTAGEQRATQALIDARLGAPLLGRAVFFGQSEVAALLELGDSAFKEELGKLLDLGVWSKAKDASRRELAAARAAAAAADAELDVRRAYAARAAEEAAAAERAAAEFEAARGRRAVEAAAALSAAAAGGGAARRALERVRAAALAEGREALGDGGGGGGGSDAATAAAAALPALDAAAAAAQATLREAQLAQGAARGRAAAARRAHDDYASHAAGAAAGAAVCDRCLQPIDAAAAAAAAAALAAEAEAAAAGAAEADAVASAAAAAADEVAAAAASARLAQLEAAEAVGAARAAAARREGAVAAADEALAELAAALSRARVAPEALPSDDDDASAFAPPLAQLAQLATAARRAAAALDAAARGAAAAGDAASPAAGDAARLAARAANEAAAADALAARRAALAADAAALRGVDEALRPAGVVAFALEGALGALEAAAGRHLAALAPGATLSLRLRAGGAGGAAERVERRVALCAPGGGPPLARAPAQLSGGERRRLALALALGFSELAARRGRLRADLLVLDEALQHLDAEGRGAAAAALRALAAELGTVLIVAQAGSALTRAVDAVDVVARAPGGGSRVECGGVGV